MSKHSPLLQPIRVGCLTMKNRVMFPPLTTGYEERDGSIGPRSLHFYQRLAKGGVGYIVVGDVAPVATASPTPKLFDDSQIPAFRALADAVHAYGSKLALQIFHPEYDVPAVGGLMRASAQAGAEAQKAKAAGDEAAFAAAMAESRRLGSAARERLNYDMEHFVSEVTPEGLADIRAAMTACAVRARKAGVDAIEIHGDRLLGSLCSTMLNHRTDSYGGCFENRVRYALEVVAAIRAAVPDMMIEYKLPLITVNADGSLRGRGGLEMEEAVAFARLLEQAGVDMIQAAQANHTGNMGDTIPPMGSVPYNWTLPVCEKIKAAVSIPVATVGRVVTVESGEQILREGRADIIGYGRSLLCDPDIAVKTERDEPVRACLNCNKGCVDALTGRRYLSCVLNAENGDEETIFLRPAEVKKKVAVVGAGIAGLEAARVAAARGHSVTVYEKEEQIGGQILLAAVPPRKAEILRAVDYYEKALPMLGVEVKLGTAASPEILNAYDAVILAVGAHERQLPVPGADGEAVLSAWDVLAGKVKPHGHCVVLGGGLVGAETAEYLLEQGCTVAIVEMLDRIAAEESGASRMLMMAHFKTARVAQYANTRVTAVAPDGRAVEAVDTQSGETVTLPCDCVVLAVGSVGNTFDTADIRVPVYAVGDCAGERTADIASAIRSAYHTANQI